MSEKKQPQKSTKDQLDYDSFHPTCKSTNVGDVADLFTAVNESSPINDCKNMEEMMARLCRAYELVALPLTKDTSFSPPDSEIVFLNRTVFPTLLPALSRALQLAKLTNSLQHHLRSFNGLDSIVEYLWNNNPKHPLRTKHTLFKIPFVKAHLKIHPRKKYPKSIYFTEDEAASVIQAFVKGFLVRCHPSVQEMRQFWKKIKAEKQESFVQQNTEEFDKDDNSLAKLFIT